MRWFWFILIAVLVSGCDIVDYHTEDLCGKTPIGSTTTATIRPTHQSITAGGNKTWPWIPSVTYTVNKSANPMLACTKTGRAKDGSAICIEETPQYVCTVQSESPSTSAVMNELASPISTAFSKVTLPAVP